MDEKQDKNPVKWSQADEAMLLHTLADEKANANWGDNNPKKVAWTACECALADSEKKSGGTAKSAQAIKNRWQRLKQEYDVVKEIRGLSGFGWDPSLNTVTAESTVWDAYIKTLSPSKAKLVKKFRTKAFPLYNAVGELVDGTRATGKNTFHAGQRSVFNPTQPQTREPTPYDFSIDLILQDISRDMESDLGDGTSMRKTVPPSSRSAQTKEPGASFYGSDKFSSDDDNMPDNPSKSQQVTPAPSLSKRKRVKSAGPSSESQKPRRVSAGQGMVDMAQSLQVVVEHMKQRREEKSQTVLDRAIQLLSDDNTLDDDNFMDAVDYFSADLEFASAYTAVKTPQMRAAILRRRMKKMRGE
ncbi:Myb/SANT-like DNA-binding domain-containing protein [Lactarius pseudohatsudake]|nr:Myb/SANT-like DNA-binding domain-containing protein [Lactarius pseudohatsudake]